MPLALLLSPDDQAVAAITSVLEEMSVTCERPLDGASAAQKLNSNRFDLVLVDCENLPAAKLIFDVCRNRKGGVHPVPVAVVDGRAGLPTAFRLGAELILTKPVSKDQARVTIRTAISRVRKEESTRTDVGTWVAESATHSTADSQSFTGMPQQASEQHADDASDYVATEGRAFAAAATAGSAPLMAESAQVPSAPANTPSMSMSAAAAESEAAETGAASPITSSFRTAAVSIGSHAASPLFASAEAEAARHEETGAEANAKPAAATESESESKAERTTSAATSSRSHSEEKIGTIEEKIQAKTVEKTSKKSHSRPITLVVLLVACGGFYAAWMYEPGFQTLVKEQINHLLVLVGKAPQTQPAPAQAPAKPISQTPKPSAGVPVQTSVPDTTKPAQPASPDQNAAAGAVSTAVTTLPTATPPASSTAPSATSAQASPSTAAAPTAAISSQAATTSAAKPGTIQTKSGTTRIDLSPNAVEHPVSPPGAKAGSAAPAPKPLQPQH
jgi:trimeric autotransporter adhesin